jgi:DNA-binding MarR family transcriptional regulator
MHRLMATHAPELNLFELTMSQTKALYLVVASGQLRMSELASRLGVTSSTATGVVDGLVGHGMLVRHEDPADRRQVVITATNEAEATLQSFRELNANRMRQLLAHVVARDLTTVERAIHVLDAAVTADEAAATIDPQGDHS